MYVCIRSVDFFIWIRFWSTEHKICTLRFLRVKEGTLRHIWASEHHEKRPSPILWGQIKDTTILNLSTSVSVPQNGVFLNSKLLMFQVLCIDRKIINFKLHHTASELSIRFNLYFSFCRVFDLPSAIGNLHLFAVGNRQLDGKVKCEKYPLNFG